MFFPFTLLSLHVLLLSMCRLSVCLFIHFLYCFCAICTLSLRSNNHVQTFYIIYTALFNEVMLTFTHFILYYKYSTSCTASELTLGASCTVKCQVGKVELYTRTNSVTYDCNTARRVFASPVCIDKGILYNIYTFVKGKSCFQVVSLCQLAVVAH